eukprot:3751381-Amphidinium_carterae.1
MRIAVRISEIEKQYSLKLINVGVPRHIRVLPASQVQADPPATARCRGCLTGQRLYLRPSCWPL